jgi:hypothetical protein
MTADVVTVTGLLLPHFERDGVAVAPGEKDGDVIVRPACAGDKWLLSQCAATLREAGIRVRQDDDHLTAQLWPYDAVRHDPLTALRIPVVRNAWPGWKYEVCVVIADPDSADGFGGPALRPDERETAQILAELEWRMTYYNEGWKAGMRKRPLDVDGSTNTVVLQKLADGDWRYRRMSFEHGLWPFFNMEQRFTLEALLDHVNDYGGEPNPKWREFKAAHPEAFAAADAQPAATTALP